MSTHNIPFSIVKKKNTLNYLNLQFWDFLQGTQKQVRNSDGKRAISGRLYSAYFSPKVDDMCCQ